ncbi:hypothetical protein [Sphingomonas sp. SKA58]|uniref:hypothetical protein n=1 Tax=Sphingomonas sp. (strain SKA58) TaxID=314266 RepID=UPI00031D414D|nr:hypothetical protein [Sphingomonas sp. SKA58]
MNNLTTAKEGQHAHDGACPDAVQRHELRDRGYDIFHEIIPYADPVARRLRNIERKS